MTAATQALATGIWTVEASSTTASFRALDLLRKAVTGTLPVVRGQVRVAADGLIDEVSAELDLAGVATGNPRRDASLRGRQFFDVDSDPVLRFAGGPAVQVTDDSWTLPGELVLREMRCPVDVRVERVGPARVRATTSLDRRDLGIRVPRVLVAHRVEVVVDAALAPVAGPSRS